MINYHLEVKNIEDCRSKCPIKYVSLVQQGDQTIEARKEILIEQREQILTRMAEMQKTLDILDYKISVYEKSVLKREKEIVQA